MPMSRPAKLALTAMLLAAFAVVAFLVMKEPALAPVTPSELTRERALELLDSVVDGCVPDGEEERYRSCELGIVLEGERATVTVTHDGFFDDSVKASRVEAVLEWREGAWVMISSVVTHQCWPGRGHQDFSDELCV